MLKTRARSLAMIAAGALLLTTALAGCGGSDDDKSGDSKSSSSGSPSGSGGSTGSSDEGDGDSGSKGSEVDAQDFIERVTAAMVSKRTAHMVIELGSSMTANADFRYTANGSPEMKMEAQTGGTRFQVILIGGTMYMQQSAGGKFLKIEKDDPGMGALLEQFGNLGPQQSIEALKDGVEKVVKVGTEKVDGEELTEYELTVDPAMIRKQFGSAAPSADQPKTSTYAMFLDDDGLMRRVDLEVNGQKIVMKVSDWGEPVEIKAPPASQVTTLG